MAWPKGKPFSPETKAKLKVARAGRIGPFTGHHHSAEARAALSAKTIGQSRPHKGHPIDEQTRLKIADATRLRMNQPEVRAWHSEAGRQRWMNPEVRQHTVDAIRAACAKPEVFAKRSEAQKRLWADPQVRRNRLDAQERLWSNTEVRERHSQIMVEVLKRKGPTSIELAVDQVLNDIGVKHYCQQRIGRYIVDFFLPDLDLVIEADGAYWHSSAQRQERDGRRDEWMLAHGYKVLRLMESQIVADVHNSVVDGLKRLGWEHL